MIREARRPPAPASRGRIDEDGPTQQDAFPARGQTQRTQLLAVVQVYKALGGGWTPETAPGQPR